MRPIASLVMTFVCVLWNLPLSAAEFLDGTPPTVRGGMHACPPNSIVTGVDVPANTFLCVGSFVGPTRSFMTGERTDGLPAPAVWPPDPATRVQHGYTGPAMHWCGPNQFVTGIHVAGNLFLCSTFVGGERLNYTSRLGRLIVGPGVVRRGMRACPPGSVLVGAHFDNGIFLCAELPFCIDDSHCGVGRRCENPSVPPRAQEAVDTGMCRPRGSTPFQLRFRSEHFCRGNGVGSLTDRSGNAVNFTDHPAFENDEAQSLLLSNVSAGAIIRVYDNSRGRQNDDWTQILVTSTTTADYCVPTFEPRGDRFTDRFVTVSYTNFGNDLDGEVSRMEVDSAVISRGGRCLDVNMNNFTVQLFTCHAGPNQRWVRRIDGTITGINGLCLEADGDAIRGWRPENPRSAAVRVGPCTGAVNQIWSMPRDQQQLRLFADMCLDIPDGRDADGTVLQVFPCHSGINQRWLNTF
ncbi:MAG TPA: RICIN domain-containing protein [Geminicoccaceae bacterium]|nr:RICIN domain-containing protein [Geminicoccaceae bacterium]